LRVLIISYHFYPSWEIGAKRLTELARYLGSENISVDVISSFADQDISAGKVLMLNVSAVPVATPKRFLLDTLVNFKRRFGPSNEEGRSELEVPPSIDIRKSAFVQLISRVIRFVRIRFFSLVYFIDDKKLWSWRAAHAGVAIGRRHKADVVISSGPPFSAVLAGLSVAQRLGVPHIADYRDPWTDTWSTVPSRARGADIFFLRLLEKIVVQRSTVVTATSTSVIELLSTRHPTSRQKFYLVRNGYDGAAQERSRDTGGYLRILFAGEIYGKRDPFPLLRALDRLCVKEGIKTDRVSLTFIGRCAEYDGVNIAEALHGRPCESLVRFLPMAPNSIVKTLISESTVLLNLAQHQHRAVPAKTYEHLASGCELLVFCEDDSDTAKLLSSIGGVLRVDPTSDESIDHALNSLYERHVVAGQLRAPQASAVAQYSRLQANKTFVSVIRKVRA